MVSIVPVVVVDVSVHCEDAVKVGLPAASRWPANPPQRPQSTTVSHKVHMGKAKHNSNAS